LNALEHILDGRYLDQPQDWDALFGRKAPLIVEIGFGRGNHLIHLAQTYPDANVIGIEVSHPSLHKIRRKRRTAGLSNLIALYGSAPQILWFSVAPDTLSDVHINFPDPWPKEGHHNRRLFNPAFMDLLATRMKPGANLFAATDHPDYQPVVTACFEETEYFDSLLPTTFVTEDTTRFRTKYEMKALAEGRTCQYYKFVRNGLPAPDVYALPQELPMPHVVVRSPLTLDDIASRFEPASCHDDSAIGQSGNRQSANRQSANRPSAEIHVRLMKLYRAVDEPALLVETHITQEPQPQRVALKIRTREPGEYMLSLHELGFPRPTTGVHVAVRCLLGWLQSIDPDLHVVQSNLRS
jgi:tRNA (guanine-N7-)-methyltransferase